MSDLSTHLAKLDSHLARFRDKGILNLINGEDVAPGQTFETRSPVDESLICTVAKGTATDIDTAAKAAKAAFPAWAAMSGEARKKILNKIADLIVERAEEIALCECWDTGQAYRFMSKAALRGAENFRYYADLAPSARDGQSLPTKTHLNVSSRSPIGPVGVITPWNTPFMLSTWKIAPALAAGCTVVHKPAEFSPLTARILAEIAHEAGLPAGVWNLVNGFGEDAGKALTEHPDIKAIAFVGESRTGSMIMKQGADTLKRVHFELGGKNPVIVFDDADLERALDAAIFMIYSLNGERCTSSSRLLVQDDQALSSATIDVLVPVNDPQSRTFLLRAIKPESVKLLPGMSVQAVLRVTTGERGLTVSRDAINRYPEGRTTVWIAEPGDEDTWTVSEKRVRLGTGFEGRVEVTSGLEADQNVVVRGNESLSEGISVRIAERESR